MRSAGGAKIFGIGHGKTGTHSLVAAAGILGYKMIHRWGDIDHDELDTKDGGADNAFAAQFIELDQRYPGSRFIYTDKKLESWLDSCKRSIPNKKPSKVGSPKYENRVAMFGYDQGLGYREGLLSEAFTRHRQRVMDYFRKRPDDLLVLNIIEGEGWETLCPFLDAPIPDVEFPHVGGKRKRKPSLMIRLFGLLD